MENEECGVQSAECGVRSAECGVRSAECGVRSAECGVRSAECGVRSAECGVWKMRTLFRLSRFLGLPLSNMDVLAVNRCANAPRTTP